MTTDLVFILPVLFISVILHEVAHGYMANYLGDPTARLAGRLTLNPLPHIDPVGTILLPLTLVLLGAPFFIGYAKPVPVNEYNLPGRYDLALVAFSGPATNLALALLFGLMVRFGGAALGPTLANAFGVIVAVNIILALFNLVPLPPLDGSKVLGGLFAAASARLARGYETFLINFQRLGMLPMILIVLVVFNVLLRPFFVPLLSGLYALLTGQSL
jgi:Zn-dependent protease